MNQLFKKSNSQNKNPQMNKPYTGNSYKIIQDKYYKIR